MCEGSEHVMSEGNELLHKSNLEKGDIPCCNAVQQ